MLVRANASILEIRYMGYLACFKKVILIIKQWIKPDYSIERSQVYSKAFNYVMMSGMKTLDLLRFCDDLGDGTSHFLGQHGHRTGTGLPLSKPFQSNMPMLELYSLQRLKALSYWKPSAS